MTRGCCFESWCDFRRWEVSSTAVRVARLSMESVDRLTGEKKNKRVTAGES